MCVYVCIYIYIYIKGFPGLLKGFTGRLQGFFAYQRVSCIFKDFP